MIRRPVVISGVVAVLTVSSFVRADATEDCVKAATDADRMRRDVTKLRGARDRLKVCAAEECPADIRTDCRTWIVDVEGKIPTVVLVARDGNGGALFDVKVRLDGAPLAERLDGMPVQLDAGAHTFTFERPSGPPVEVKSVLVAGQKNVEIVASFPSPERVTPPSVAPATPRESGLSGLRIAGLVTAGVGVVGLGVGTFFGLRASSLQSDAKCPDNVCGEGSDPEALRDAKSAGNLSTIFFVAGGALTAGGLALFFFAPRDERASTAPKVVPIVGLGSAGVRLRF